MSIRLSSGGLLAALSLAALAAPASAQAPASRWLALAGCWEATPAATGAPMLCILPLGGDAVQMVAIANGQVVTREQVVANGEMQEGTREGCTGWERARFSADGRRIYLDGEHMCGTVRQESKGLIALISRTEWIDVRTLSVDGRPVTGVSHYTLAPIDVAEAAGFGNIAADQAMAVRAARTSASAGLTIEEVIDAHRVVGSDVVRAWVAERKQPFQLNADRLVQMADAGVSPEVIDVVVAVSYPQRFTVADGAQVAQNEVQRSDYLDEPGMRGLGGRRGGFWSPIYGYGYGNYYNDYFYGGYYGRGYLDGYYGYPGIYRPTVVVVETRDPEPQSRGRVVNGRGYTRTRASEPSTGSSSGGSSSSGSSASPSSSSSGSSEPSSSGTSTGRTARPREP
jgi:hypothetical protein